MEDTPMMRAARRASLLAVFCILTLTATAHGSRALVLWVYAVSVKAESWLPYDSYERLAECKRDAEVGQKKAQQKPDKTVSYICLPDTINPMATKPTL
jgi:hypothetical protein